MSIYYPPASRFTDFEVGVIQGIIGGIPTSLGGDDIDAADFGFAEGQTAAQNQAHFISARDASAAGDIIHIPAGDFACDQLTLTYVHNNRIVRGAGRTLTRLRPSASPQGGCAIAGSVNYGSGGVPGVANANSTITAISQGSNVITVADASSFPSATRFIARIWLKNEFDTPIVSVANFPFIRFFTVVFLSKSGNNLTLLQPIPGDYSAEALDGAYIEMAHQITSIHVTNIGLEDMTFDSEDAGDLMSIGVIMEGCSECWLKGVGVTEAKNYGIRLYDQGNCEIRDCWVNGPGGTPTNNSGILVNICSNNVIEDNVFLNTFPCMEVNSGSTANYIGSNFSNGVININHGPWNSYNLYEFNDVPYFHADGYFGGVSEDTFHRNRCTLVAVVLKRFSRNINEVGNLYCNIVGDGDENTGLPNIGNGSSNGNAEYSTGDYWYDWDHANDRPKEWTGVLTTRDPATAIGTCTVDAGTNVITVSTTHGLSADTRVQFTNSGGTLPAGISADTPYYVLTTPSGTTLTVSATLGGSVLDITGTGTGTHSIRPFDFYSGTGTVTIDSGQETDFAGSFALSGDGVRLVNFTGGGGGGGSVRILSVVGQVATFDAASFILPTISAVALLRAGPTGFQEIDEDVRNTRIQKANWRAYLDDIPAGEALGGGETLADSYARASTPQFYTDASKTWPPYDPFDPDTTNVSNRTPASQRFSDFIPPEAPEFTVEVTISGSGAEGTTLTATPGTVTGNPTPTSSLQWQVDDGGGFDDIVGETATTYNVPIGSGYATFPVRCIQTATNGESPDATSTSNSITITLYMGDVNTITQTVNVASVIELWSIDGVEQVFAHSGDYPAGNGWDTDSGSVILPNNGTTRFNEHGPLDELVYVFSNPPTTNLAQAKAARDTL